MRIFLHAIQQMHEDDQGLPPRNFGDPFLGRNLLQCRRLSVLTPCGVHARYARLLAVVAQGEKVVLFSERMYLWLTLFFYFHLVPSIDRVY